MEDVLGFLARQIFHLIAGLFLHGTARLVLPIVSFGYLRTEPLRKAMILSSVCVRKEKGVWLLDPLTSMFAGIFIWFAVFAAIALAVT